MLGDRWPAGEAEAAPGSVPADGISPLEGAAPLRSIVDILPGAGHIAVSDGYGPWPSALAWGLDSAARLAVK